MAWRWHAAHRRATICHAHTSAAGVAAVLHRQCCHDGRHLPIEAHLPGRVVSANFCQAKRCSRRAGLHTTSQSEAAMTPPLEQYLFYSQSMLRLCKSRCGLLPQSVPADAVKKTDGPLGPAGRHCRLLAADIRSSQLQAPCDNCTTFMTTGTWALSTNARVSGT